MIIEGTFFKLTPSNEHSDFFDLELLYNIGGKNPRKEFKNAGYGLTMTHAIKSIINFAINQKFDEKEVISLKQYVEEYKKTKSEIEKLIS